MNYQGFEYDKLILYKFSTLKNGIAQFNQISFLTQCISSMIIPALIKQIVIKQLFDFKIKLYFNSINYLQRLIAQLLQYYFSVSSALVNIYLMQKNHFICKQQPEVRSVINIFRQIIIETNLTIPQFQYQQ
ncbi:unnamed protein product [Paramecium octaurelia]|uniref:Transmembrane protein n=1 Tax=Paramecium octaurelia TaxID=43137 RepID=A0A8S1U1D0_PAROT|nr:unnamed protein product [Paramecium octaurelia]